MPSTRNGTSQDTPGKDLKGEGEEESSASEEDSCSYDEGETEKRKYRCLDNMLQLEKQFSEMNELLYKERMQDIDQKMDLLTEDSAPEYTNPVKELKDSIDQRLQVAGYISFLNADILLECKSANVKNKYQQEMDASNIDYENSCKLAKFRMETEVEDKIQKLEEDLMMEMALESVSRKRKPRPLEFFLPEKRKKPVTVTDPCVVYMLRDIDIMEDLNDIRKGIAIADVKSKHSLLS